MDADRWVSDLTGPFREGNPLPCRQGRLDLVGSVGVVPDPDYCISPDLKEIEL